MNIKNELNEVKNELLKCQNENKKLKGSFSIGDINNN